MKIKLVFALILCLLLTSCGFNKENSEEIIYGDINEDIEYSDGTHLESLVARKDKLEVSDYFKKIPIEITQDVVKSQLPDAYGNVYNIERIQLNNVYFDINEIANQNVHDYYIEDGFLKLNINLGETDAINIQVAQISNEETNIIDIDSLEILNEIINEYETIYEEDPNHVSGEYGNFYTYSKYVDFFNEHEEFKKDISIYDRKDILQFIIDMFGLKYSPNDFLSNERCTAEEYSDWYEVTNDYWLANSDDIGYETKITVKRNSDGIFVIMARYPHDFTVDSVTGKDYFTPTMIINLAQNNYYQLAENFDDYVNRINVQ